MDFIPEVRSARPRRVAFATAASDEITLLAWRWATMHFLTPGDDVFILHASGKDKAAEVDTWLHPEINTSLETMYRLSHVVGLGGDPRESILAFVKQEEMDILVLGSRGLVGMQRAWMGSFADHAVHHSSCPVVIVRDQIREHLHAPQLAFSSGRLTAAGSAAAAQLVGRGVGEATGAADMPSTPHSARDGKKARVVAIAVDGSPMSFLVVTWAVHNVLKPEDQIELIHSGPGAASVNAEYFMRPYNAKLAEGLAPKLPPKLVTLPGDPREVIPSHINGLGGHVEFMVLGSRGIVGIKGAMLGSVSDAVLHKVNCPCVLVREQDKVDTE